ncbi:MAG: hypothetical protein AB7I19_10295 [Planctomycetota bacterium]
MLYPDFESFYAAEVPKLRDWLRGHKAPDPENVAHESGARAWKFARHCPEKWTQPYLRKIARGILKREGERYGHVVFQLDEELGADDADDLPTLDRLFGGSLPVGSEDLRRRGEGLREVLRDDLNTAQRLALALPDLYNQPISFVAQVLLRSDDTVNRRRREAKSILQDANLSGDGSACEIRLFLLDLPQDRARNVARRKQTVFSLDALPRQPSLDAEGRFELDVLRPATLAEPFECRAIVHAVAPTRKLVMSYATEVEWTGANEVGWSMSLAPRFETAVSGADIRAVYFFEGDYIAGKD